MALSTGNIPESWDWPGVYLAIKKITYIWKGQRNAEERGDVQSLPLLSTEGIVLLFVFALLQVTRQVTSLQKGVNNNKLDFKL